MRFKTLVFFSAIITCAVINKVQAQTPEEIIQMYIDSAGRANLSHVNSIHGSGKIIQAGLEIPFNMYVERPSKFRIDGTYQGITFIQTYNGVIGWDLNPFSGMTEPQLMNADQLEEMKSNADMDGRLWNWKEKGSTVSLEPEEVVEGAKCYKIKLITSDGDAYYYFISQESKMLIRTSSKVNMQGVETDADTYMSNFMLADGIKFPGKTENRLGGVTGIVFIFDKMELNKQFPEGLFEKPEVH